MTEAIRLACIALLFVIYVHTCAGDSVIPLALELIYSPVRQIFFSCWPASASCYHRWSAHHLIASASSIAVQYANPSVVLDFCCFVPVLNTQCTHTHTHCTTSCPQTCPAAFFSVVAEIDQPSLEVMLKKTFTHSTELISIAFPHKHQPHFSCSRNPPLQKQSC